MKSLHSKDKTGILIIIACVVSVLTLAGIALAAGVWTTPSGASNGCQVATPLQSHLAILIDSTDSLTSSQKSYALDRVASLANAVKQGAKVAVYVIKGEDEELIEPVFSRCSPRNPAHADPLIENLDRIQERFEQEFRKPLLAAVQQATSDAVASSSPILESIQAVSELREFSTIVPERRLLIISDMLQNTRGCSHYQGDDYQESIACTRYASTVVANLSMVEVEIICLRRIQARALQTPSHTDFWEEYFDASGATKPEISKR